MRPATSPLSLVPLALLVEVALLVVTSVIVGPLPVLAWTVLSMVLGYRLLRSVGAGVESALSAFSAVDPHLGGLNPSALPRELALDAALRTASGALLFIPGLLTDLAGLALAIGPVRRAVAGRLLDRHGAPRTTGKDSRSPRRAARTRGATVDVDVIRPEDAPPSPFEHPPRVITVEPSRRR